jgi:hypothetical protein
MQSLRDHQLAVQSAELRAKRLSDKPGRPDRAALLARQDWLDEGTTARAHVDEALEELNRLDAFCLDPVNGLALVPFVHEEQLAWFIIDLFAEDMLTAWRYHEDPLETRRPIGEVSGPEPAFIAAFTPARPAYGRCGRADSGAPGRRSSGCR